MKTDKQFIESSGHWPGWPFLPLKRDRKKYPEHTGMLVDVQRISETFDKNHSSLRTILFASIYAVAAGEVDLKSVKKQEYPSIDAMLADGWMVD